MRANQPERKCRMDRNGERRKDKNLLQIFKNVEKEGVKCWLKS